MMKKHLLALLLGSLAFSAQAHRVWVATDHAHGGEILKADLGYGEFPEFEPIPEKRLHFFKPLQLITDKGKQNLVQKGQHNYQYQSQQVVDEGSYLVVAEYQPTFWSKDKNGKWNNDHLKNTPEAVYCEQTSMHGKTIANVGHDSTSKAVISKPVGQKLEIVPLENPANVPVGERLKVKVLLNGEPLPNVVLTATFDGFDTSDRSKTHKVEAQAFSDKTGDDGTVDIIPLRQGFWKASVEHKLPYQDQAVCQHQAMYATLTFQIGHTHH